MLANRHQRFRNRASVAERFGAFDIVRPDSDSQSQQLSAPALEGEYLQAGTATDNDKAVTSAGLTIEEAAEGVRRFARFFSAYKP